MQKVQALIERCCDLVRVNESNRVSSSIVSLISSAAVLDMFLVRELQGLEEIRSLTVPAILAQKGQRQSPLALERPGEPAFCVLDSVVQSVQIFAAPIRWAVLQARRIFAVCLSILASSFQVTALTLVHCCIGSKDSAPSVEFRTIHCRNAVEAVAAKQTRLFSRDLRVVLREVDTGYK